MEPMTDLVLRSTTDVVPFVMFWAYSRLPSALTARYPAEVRGMVSMAALEAVSTTTIVPLGNPTYSRVLSGLTAIPDALYPDELYPASGSPSLASVVPSYAITTWLYGSFQASGYSTL